MLPTKSTFDEYVKKGLIRSQTYKDMTIYQYTEFTQFESLWNNCTLNARGIVFDDDGAIVQRCIPKFFNHDEPDGIKVEKLMLKERSPVVQEKLDGSLIKITKDEKHGLVITSKASFESDQARMAKEIVDENNYEFKEGWTYHFELIHPDNQIVLNYGDERKLVLLAIIDNETGKDINIYTDDLKFEKPKLYDYETLLDINALNKDGLHEGVVVNYGSYRLKYKTDEYIRLHRIVTEFSAKRVWEALSNGQRIDRMNIPEEFIKWLDDTEKELLDKYNELFSKVNQAFVITRDMTNKEIALSDNEVVKEMREYIFAIRSGKDIEAKIWKSIKPKGEK
jgi:RNA ligase